MLGTNDTKEYNWSTHGTEFRDDYNALIDTIQKLQSSPKVWVVIPCPVWNNQYAIRDSIIGIIIPILKDIAAQRNLGVIDANTPLKAQKNLFPDGVHPNAAGADSLAGIFHKALTTIVAIERSEISRNASRMSQSSGPHTVINFFAIWKKKTF
jgi:alpha-L-fucosidase 2